MAKEPDFLQFSDLPEPVGTGEDDWAVVDVPEFGPGKSVKVRALSAGEWAFLMRKAYPPTGNGTEPEYSLDYDEVALTAALCTYDGQGQRVFGKTVEQAIQRTYGLQREYRTALSRIHRRVMQLSALVADPKKEAG